MASPTKHKSGTTLTLTAKGQLTLAPFGAILHKH